MRQGRIKVDKWQDAATGTKRTAFKITATSIAKVRRSANYGAAGGEGGEEADAGMAPWDTPPAAGGSGPAPWDVQPQAGGRQQGAGAGSRQGAQGGASTEEKWMDFFEHPDRESSWALWACLALLVLAWSA